MRRREHAPLLAAGSADATLTGHLSAKFSKRCTIIKARKVEDQTAMSS